MLFSFHRLVQVVSQGSRHDRRGLRRPRTIAGVRYPPCQNPFCSSASALRAGRVGQV